MLRAYHRLIMPDGQEHTMVVCHIDDATGVLIDYHPLQGEEPFVEWIGGTLDLKNMP
ncbi:MAG: hypothetical protein IJS59_07355 [Bacteroidaceae bacterium]|nr:hypothetical protein [Bacteroidaceae bacterium]